MTLELTEYEWDLEERVEDAVVAHLRNEIGVKAMVIASGEVVEAEFPLVVVIAGTSSNHSDPALFNGKRQVEVTIGIMSEATNFPENGEPENTMTGRQVHRAIKSAVIRAVATKNLKEYLNATGVPGIAFSMAHMTDQDRDKGDNKFMTMQTLDIIYGPKDIA